VQRNPLHIVTASASMLKDCLEPEHPGRQDVDAIINASESLHR
jgi:hypothetical protein